MGSKFLSCAVLCFLIFSDSYADRAYDDIDDDVRTLVNYSENDGEDKEQWFDANEKVTVDETNKESSLLEQQKSFVKKVYQGIEDSPESVIALKDLTDNSLEATQESLNSIKDNPDTAFCQAPKD